MQVLRSKLALIPALAGALVILVSSGAQAQDYKTSKSCKMCHMGPHKGIVEGVQKIGHARALQDATKNPEVVVAVFDDNSPIKKDQIKYVLGSGRTTQAYIGADNKTLPAEWNTKEKKWVATTAEDAHKQCIGCHVTGYDSAKSAWAEDGVTCEACHGPGAAHASTGDKTKILNPHSLSPDKSSMICGQCHSKGTDTTKAFAFPVAYKTGGDLSTAFVDAQPKTAGRNQQFSELKQSKHFANGVGCVSCHQPHGAGTTQPTQLVKPVNELCVGCHGDKPMATHAPNAPATATCATCHMPGGSHSFAKPGA